jgi:hypothetical protein
MQIHTSWHFTNVGNRNIHVLRAQIVSPKVEGVVAVRAPNQNVFGDYPIVPGPMGAAVPGVADFWVSPAAKERGQPFSTRVRFFDQLGNRYLTEKVTLPFS